MFLINIRRLSSPITFSCNAIGIAAVRGLSMMSRGRARRCRPRRGVGVAGPVNAIARQSFRASAARSAVSLLGHLFVQALALCQAAGVVRLDRVALDGTRVRANVLAAEVSALLADAERIDKDEDATFGKNRRGGVVSEQPRRRETGLAEIGAACEGAGVGGEATGRSTAQRLLVGALLLALMFAGGYAVAAHKTLTLSVDGLPMTVSTMKSRVFDVVRQNGFAVGEHDSVYPGANQPVHQSDTIVLRRVGRHVPQLDLTHASEQSRRTSIGSTRAGGPGNQGSQGNAGQPGHAATGSEGGAGDES